MARTLYLPQRQPESFRLVGIGASILLNAALFMFLMQPPAVSHRPETVVEAPPVEFVVKPKDVVIEKVKTDKPVTADPTVHAVVRQHVETKITTHTVVLNPDTSAVGVKVEPTIGPTVIDPPPVVTGPVEVSLVPVENPAPPYPRDALNEGITGTVQLELLVGVDGRVLEVKVVRSSGNRQLDAAAREQVLRHWIFQPAMVNGTAVQGLGRVPIVFTIGNP